MHCVNLILISVPLIYFACYTFVKLYYIYVGRKTNKLELELELELKSTKQKTKTTM